jgi:phenylpyruvate tautomerase
MPLVRIETTTVPDAAQSEALLAGVSRAVEAATGKPLATIMATLSAADIRMAGRDGPAAFVDVRGIGGLTREVNNRMAASVTDLLENALGVPPDRVYLTFQDVPATNWAWKRATFG